MKYIGPPSMALILGACLIVVLVGIWSIDWGEMFPSEDSILHDSMREHVRVYLADLPDFSFIGRSTPPVSPMNGDLYAHIMEPPQPLEFCYYDGERWHALTSNNDENCL